MNIIFGVAAISSKKTTTLLWVLNSFLLICDPRGNGDVFLSPRSHLCVLADLHTSGVYVRAVHNVV